MYVYDVRNQKYNIYLDDEPVKNGEFDFAIGWATLNNIPVVGVAVHWEWYPEGEFDLFLYTKD